jgi:hypothetical protein
MLFKVKHKLLATIVIAIIQFIFRVLSNNIGLLHTLKFITNTRKYMDEMKKRQ